MSYPHDSGQTAAAPVAQRPAAMPHPPPVPSPHERVLVECSPLHLHVVQQVTDTAALFRSAPYTVSAATGGQLQYGGVGGVSVSRAPKAGSSGGAVGNSALLYVVCQAV